MRRSRHVVLLLAVTAAACGGEMEAGEDDFHNRAGSGGNGSAGTGNDGGTTGYPGGTTSNPGGTGNPGGTTGIPGGTAGSAGYEDPGCPPQEPLPHQNECELFEEPSGCPSGTSCYPYVQYPTEPCGQEIYGTACAPAGTGTQGDPCTGDLCAANHICVITGQGIQCVQVCPLVGEDHCPPGLICSSVDVEGVGACF